MKIILTKEVLGLGDPGEIVQVKDGYARNYLVPQKMAIAATKHNMAQVEAERKRISILQAKEADQMKTLGQAIKALDLTLSVRAGEGGRLYGSVTNMDVAQLLVANGQEVDRRRIIMEPIKKLGSHSIKVKLHPQVVVDLEVKVVANNEKQAAETPEKAAHTEPLAVAETLEEEA